MTTSADQTKTKTLNFPNQSRSFDAARNRVRFWGYDRAIEISFFVEAEALQKFSPATCGTEAGFLEAFDGARERIHRVADKVYSNDRTTTYAYSLAADDF